jgi:hypothetical protein
MESQTAMMRARWAGDRTESVSSTATIAARVDGLIVAGLLGCAVFMLPTFPKGERHCKPKIWHTCECNHAQHNRYYATLPKLAMQPQYIQWITEGENRGIVAQFGKSA